MKEKIKKLLKVLEWEINSSMDAGDSPDSTSWEGQEGVLISRDQALLLTKIITREAFIDEEPVTAEDTLREIVDDHYRTVPAIGKEPFAYHHPDDTHRRLALRAMREFTEGKTIQITRQAEKIKQAAELLKEAGRHLSFNEHRELIQNAAAWLQSPKINTTLNAAG